jgi:prepilin-type N-terminal cleavage/methylation domain-containing protein
MNTSSPARAPHRAFTLVELLVVIAILAVLASMGLGAYGLAIRKARGVEDKNAAAALAMAIASYCGDYGYFPGGGGSGGADMRTESDAALINTLLAFGPEGEARNPRGIRYYSGATAKGRNASSAYRGLFYSGGSSVELFDVWKKRPPAKRHYQVVMDSNHDGEIEDPIASGETVYGMPVLVWSTGRDGEDGGGDPEAPANRDNSYSWR